MTSWFKVVDARLLDMRVLGSLLSMNACNHLLQDGIFPASQFLTVDETHYIHFSGLEERHEFSAFQSMRIGFATLPLDRYS